MQLQHSQPATRPSAIHIDPAYLRTFVTQLSFPRAIGTPANAEAEKIVHAEMAKILGSCSVVGETRNLCSGNPQTARILIGAALRLRAGHAGS